MKANDITRASETASDAQASSRREFLGKAGRFAVVTPPSVTFLLTTSMDRSVAASTAPNSSAVGGSSSSGCSRGTIICFFENLFS